MNGKQRSTVYMQVASQNKEIPIESLEAQQLNEEIFSNLKQKCRAASGKPKR